MLRVFSPQPTLIDIQYREKTLGIFKESDYLPWELNPGKEVTHIGPEKDWKVDVKINSKRLRDEEIDYLPKGNEYIIVTGDSFSFGYGVELYESYPKVLERILNENANDDDKKFRVINAGFASGNSIDTAYLFLRNEGMKYKPKVVIFGYLPGNDLEDIEGHYWELDENGLPVKIKQPYLFINNEGNRQANSTYVSNEKANILWITHVFMSKYSHAYTFFKNGIKNTIGMVFRRLFEPKVDTIYDNIYGQIFQSGWEKTKFMFLETNSLLKRNNATLVIVYIPEKGQYNNENWREYLYVNKKDENDVSRNKPDDMMREFAEDNGILFADLYPAFHERQNEKLYFNIDPHWTARGHELAAQTIYSYMKDQTLELSSYRSLSEQRIY